MACVEEASMLPLIMISNTCDAISKSQNLVPNNKPIHTHGGILGQILAVNVNVNAIQWTNSFCCEKMTRSQAPSYTQMWV